MIKHVIKCNNLQKASKDKSFLIVGISEIKAHMTICSLTSENSAFDDYADSEIALYPNHSSPKRYITFNGAEDIRFQDPFPDEDMHHTPSKAIVRKQNWIPNQIVTDVFLSNGNADNDKSDDNLVIDLMHSDESNALVIDMSRHGKDDTWIAVNPPESSSSNIMEPNIRRNISGHDKVCTNNVDMHSENEVNFDSEDNSGKEIAFSVSKCASKSDGINISEER